MLNALQNRDFVRLWTAHGQRVYAYILTLVPQTADADEIFQDTGVTLWEKFDEFESGTNFKAWACRVALNKVRNFRQLRRHHMLHLGDAFIDLVDQTATARADVLDLQNKALADCFSRLAAKDQDLIQRRYQQGASVKGVAGAIGRSTDAVYKALARIHNTLLQCVTLAVRKEGTS